MLLQAQAKQLSRDEQTQIKDQIKEDLVEHLYRSNLTANLTGFFTSLGVFLYFYNHASFSILITWLISFNILLLFITIITLAYRKYQHKLDVRTWELALGFSIIGCATLWGITVFFNPNDLIHQYLLFGILFMLSAAYSMGTVGEFNIGLTSLTIMLMPITLWCFYQRDFIHILAGTFVVLYYFFLIGMNRRSSEWLINSLKLKIENSYFTHQANHDLLTDLPNQRLLLRLMDNYISDAEKTNVNFVIICFAVNRLEMFNNSLGYQASDLIMQTLAKRFRTIIGEANYRDNLKVNRAIALPRSDSFTFLIEPVALTQINDEVNSLFRALDTPFHLGQREAKLTASAGISLYPRDGTNARSLLSNAYAAMFKAKQVGGNKIEYYQKEINEKTPTMLELENDLHTALVKNQFVVYYQPFVDLTTGKISGMEALIRWQHPRRGLVPPNDFIPLAAETGLIIPIGAWVLEEACRQTQLWHQAGFGDIALKVSVNLSVKQLHHGDLLDIVDQALKNTHLLPQYLDLELTETEMLDEKLAPIIHKLTSKGVTLSIDDFGTGYSGLSYLKFFRVDKIKIDRSFIQDVTTNNDSATIVSAILAMGKELNIKTLAEGVETKEQLQFLMERNCHYVQGFYFSKPIPANDFAKLLKTFQVDLNKLK